MLKKVEVAPRDFQDYVRFLDEKNYDKLIKLAEALRGKKIVHLNSTAQGGGVAEILHSLIPIERSLGLDVDWLVFSDFPNQDEFFEITKKMHNSLQGSKDVLTDSEKSLYQSVNQGLAQELRLIAPHLLIIHDPQPCGIIDDFSEIPMISRIHIDLTRPNPDTLSFVGNYLKKYDCTLFSSKDFVPKKLRLENTIISYPAIDPLSEKNIEMDEKEAEDILRCLGIDTKRPIVTQVSRFDPWKDPFGVIDAFKIIKKDYPQAQLVLSGIVQAQDDPEALRVIEEVKTKAAETEDVIMFTQIDQLGDISDKKFINAIQTKSDVIFQKSLREGFGLTIAEAMWKKQPVIGGDVGGIRLQIEDGKNGYLVSSVAEAAKKALYLLGNPGKRQKMGLAAQASVKKKFLITRFLQDELVTMSKVREKAIIQ